MFVNKIRSGNPVCPLCGEECTADRGQTTGVTETPRGLFIVHKKCLTRFNELQTLRAEFDL